jgi:ketosteroid isomerase-like protein
MTESSMNPICEKNRVLVERYFDLVASGDPEIATLFSENAVWVTPQSSPMGRRHEGKDAVLALMSGGVGLYDADTPMEIRRDAVAADGEHVFVEMTMNARTGQGEPYQNHYVFVFKLQDGLIVEVHEHLDTLYAQRKLFDPVGQKSPLDSEG